MSGQYFLLLRKYNLLKYWNKDELIHIKNGNKWKMMVKDLALGMAWKNDWKSIKKSNNLKLFYGNFFSCYDGMKVYPTDKVFDSLSKLNEFIGFDGYLEFYLVHNLLIMKKKW